MVNIIHVPPPPPTPAGVGGTRWGGDKREGGQSFDEFQVTSWNGITENIIPFFDKYPLQGAKSRDYADFKKVADIMKVKGHLSKDGLDQILKIKSGMNKVRSS